MVTYEKLQLTTKKSDGETADGPTFNPSKTFGGERNLIKNIAYNDDKLESQDQKR